MRYLTSSIDRAMAMGASYLLNVGPDAEGVIGGEYEKRIQKVGDWYNRMQGALECHESDEYGLKFVGASPIATTKNSKTYLHFYNGLASFGVCIKNAPFHPKSIKLLNTGEDIEAEFEKIPSVIDGGFTAELLHLKNIPADELSNEAIVIEIEWDIK